MGFSGIEDYFLAMLHLEDLVDYGSVRVVVSIDVMSGLLMFLQTIIRENWCFSRQINSWLLLFILLEWFI